MRLPPVLFLLLFLSCAKGEVIDINNNGIIKVNESQVSVKKVGGYIPDSVFIDDKVIHGQGCAIVDNYLYRLFDGGYCSVFNINTIDDISYCHGFKLDSYSSFNHANCAQYDRISGLFYISAFKERKCNVESIDAINGSSTLIQQIEIKESEVLGEGCLNVICGDDGFLWAFGGPESGFGTLVFLKFRKPAISLYDSGRIILDENDLVDLWRQDDIISVQGGVVKHGYLFFLSGSLTSNKKILAYNTSTHEMEYLIILDDVVAEEPEDIDFWGNYLVVTVYGGSAYYALDMSELLYGSKQ